MRLRSLRLRLLAAAALSLILALILAAWGLVGLFEAHVERRLDNELKSHVRQLIGGIKLNQQGQLQLDVTLADPRFAEPFSGLYWQVQDETRPTLLRSRSLWDQVLPLPPDELSVGDVHLHQLSGPQGQTLMVEERQIILRPSTDARRLRVAVALDRADLSKAGQAFAADMWPYILLLAVFLMLASALQISIGLAPMARVRKGVADIRSGRMRRLDGDFPNEVGPLVDEINELLAASEATVERARAWTADLAHGLKTPLTALSADAQRLRNQGHKEIADQFEQLIETMRARLDRELVRARLRSHAISSAHGSVDRADLLKALSGVKAALERTPKGMNLTWVMDLPEDFPALPIHQVDLTELLGNLMDNASKWAEHQVRVSVVRDSGLILSIEDDGRGVSEEQLSNLGQRGLRLDETISGYGLGLAIVGDICDAYNIDLGFSRSKLGGLAVQLRIAVVD